MRLWLIRHAHAGYGVSTGTRAVSSMGESEIGALARFLRHPGIRPPTEIWHSPLLRARQTAEALVRTAAWKGSLVESDVLLPDDSILPVVERLEDREGDLAIVGHEPHLGRLASWLVTGDSDAEVFKMLTATILCLDDGPFHTDQTPLFRKWIVRWMITPELARESS